MVFSIHFNRYYHVVSNCTDLDSSCGSEIDINHRLVTQPGPDSLFARVTYVVDVTECPIQRPAISDLENQTWSHKKGANTLKYESTPLHDHKTPCSLQLHFLGIGTFILNNFTSEYDLIGLL